MSLVPYDVQGWFHADWLYNHIAETIPAGSVLVEVGAWLGQSTISMARYLKARGDASIKFYTVDTWNGAPGESIQEKLIRELAEKGTTLYDQFMENLRRYDVVDWVTPIRKTSSNAARLFADESVAFVYLDGDHSFNEVCRDIRTWLPKLSPSGILSGDDWATPAYEEVERAVRTMLDGYQIHVPCEYTWLVHKDRT